MQIDRSTSGMPPRKVRKKTPPAASGRDRLIGDLPDGALQCVLSLLPAQDAVRTCLLARRWRHVWKSAAGLHILCGGAARQQFADSLLRVRGSTAIDTCEFRLLELDEDDVHRIDVWIRHVLRCKGPKHNVEIKLSCKPMEKSAAASEHLSTVVIKCEALDARVFNVLKFLGKLNIWFQFSE